VAKKLPPTGTIEIAPSILSADFSRLGEHILQVAGAVKMIHLDIMDGHFVPNITIGPVVLRKIRPICNLFFDTHLMITDPARYAPEFIQAGADGITFHLEAVDDPETIIKQLRDLSVAVGISIKPKTPVAALEPIIEKVDMVLLMTVEPGFGGQSFLPDSPQRCRELKQMLRPDQRLEVDGGIDPTTAPIITQAGADTLVAGNAIFAQDHPARQVKTILNAAVSN
jgi:ribulose-phosphate 3-epimerase